MLVLPSYSVSSPWDPSVGLLGPIPALGRDARLRPEKRGPLGPALLGGCPVWDPSAVALRGVGLVGPVPAFEPGRPVSTGEAWPHGARPLRRWSVWARLLSPFGARAFSAPSRPSGRDSRLRPERRGLLGPVLAALAPFGTRHLRPSGRWPCAPSRPSGSLGPGCPASAGEAWPSGPVLVGRPRRLSSLVAPVPGLARGG